MKRRRKCPSWSIINYNYDTALVKNKHIYTVHWFQSSWSQKSKTVTGRGRKPTVGLSIKHQTQGDPPCNISLCTCITKCLKNTLKPNKQIIVIHIPVLQCPNLMFCSVLPLKIYSKIKVKASLTEGDTSIWILMLDIQVGDTCWSVDVPVRGCRCWGSSWASRGSRLCRAPGPLGVPPPSEAWCQRLMQTCWCTQIYGWKHNSFTLKEGKHVFS